MTSSGRARSPGRRQHRQKYATAPDRCGHRPGDRSALQCAPGPSPHDLPAHGDTPTTAPSRQHLRAPRAGGTTDSPNPSREDDSPMSQARLPEGDWIRGISVKQPHAACILTGAKRVENRPRPWKPGWVLLHAGKTTDQHALHLPFVGRTIRGRQLVTGAVLGVARITDCHHDTDRSTGRCGYWNWRNATQSLDWWAGCRGRCPQLRGCSKTAGLRLDHQSRVLGKHFHHQQARCPWPEIVRFLDRDEPNSKVESPRERVPAVGMRRPESLHMQRLRAVRL